MADPALIFKDEYPVVMTCRDPTDSLPIYISKRLRSPFYKFTEQKYVDSFFESGCLRIGTLFDYHRIETHGNARGDDREGLMRYLDRQGRECEALSQNNWTFCVSRGLSGRLRTEFGGAGYRINDWRFFHEVTRALRGNMIARTEPGVIADVRYVNSAIPFPPGSEKILYAGVRKDRAKYAYQNEARAMWQTDPPLATDYIMGTADQRPQAIRDYIDSENARVPVMVIEVPAAVRFCTRL